MRTFTDEHYRKMHENERRRALEKLIVSKEFSIMGKKTTVCLLVLKNGMEILGTSFLADYDNVNKSIGEYYAYEDALNHVKTIVKIMNQVKQHEENNKIRP